MTVLSPAVQRAASTASTSVREHPFGAALLGMGLAWLIGSRIGAPRMVGRALHSAGDALSARGSRLRRTAARAGTSMSEIGETVASGLGQTMDATTSSAREIADEALDVGAEAADHASRYGREAVEHWRESLPPNASGQLRATRDWLSRTLENEPLLLAAGGFALGAAIAATLPAGESKSQADGLGATGAAAREAEDLQARLL